MTNCKKINQSKLRAAMAFGGFTFEDVAQAISLTRQHFWARLKGPGFTESEIRKMARFLELDFRFLVGDGSNRE